MTRHTRNLFWFCLAFFLTLATLPAFATDQLRHDHDTQSQVQGQTQSQTSANSNANSSSLATNDDVSTGYSHDSDYLAVGLAGVARAVEARDCHESFGGKSGLGIGTGGRSVINESCQSFQQCMSLVSVYVELWERDLAVAQLAQCGGQPVPEARTYPVEAPVDTTETFEESCPEHAERVLEVCLSK